MQKQRKNAQILQLNISYSNMQEIKYILFDAANTIIHKPQFWYKLDNVLKNHLVYFPLNKLKYHHKLISENITFPEKTSKDFYDYFNSEFLISLGIIPTIEFLDDIFLNCSYFPWEKYEDSYVLELISKPIGILSNFNYSLNPIITKIFPSIHFENVFISENEKIAKPSLEFYQRVVNQLSLEPNEILYIGDSLKLDIIPAREIGFQSYLIDRIKFYPNFEKRITSLISLLDII